jgi:hypothetical protein
MSSNIKTVIDYDRKDVTVHGAQVDPVIPEHFQEQYPTLVKFLKAYYEYLDSDGQFGSRINNLFNIRDVNEVDSDIASLLFEERVPGIDTEAFISPSFAYKLLPNFYKTKGTQVSIDGFFRYFYNSDIEKILPRYQMFTVGESELGAQSEKYIQDSYFYQIYSILLKTNLPASAYSGYYKNFLHPAGYAAFYQNSFEEVASVSFAPESNIAQLEIGQFSSGTLVEASAGLLMGGIGSITLVDSAIDRRLNAGTTINFYEEMQKNYFERFEDVLSDSPYNGQYNTIADILDPNSPRWSSDVDNNNISLNMSDSSEAGFGSGPDFGDSDDQTFDANPFSISGTTNQIILPGIKFSNTLERFDEDKFQFFDPYVYPDSDHMLNDSVPV